MVTQVFFRHLSKVQHPSQKARRGPWVRVAEECSVLTEAQEQALETDLDDEACREIEATGGGYQGPQATLNARTLSGGACVRKAE